jgi:hypothetical protein
MKLRSWCLAAILVVLPVLANAVGYTGSFKVVEYHLDLNGSAWNLWIKADPAVLSGCANSAFYVLPMDYPYAKERYSAILAAFAAGKTVEVYISSCYPSGGTSYPLVDQSRFKIGE